jgi:hypothetical protein
MVMELTKRDPTGRLAQDHFSFRQEHPGPMPNLGEAVLHGAILAGFVRESSRTKPVQLDDGQGAALADGGEGLV